MKRTTLKVRKTRSSSRLSEDYGDFYIQDAIRGKIVASGLETLEEARDVLKCLFVKEYFDHVTYELGAVPYDSVAGEWCFRRENRMAVARLMNF